VWMFFAAKIKAASGKGNGTRVEMAARALSTLPASSKRDSHG
jgi:hypothetical protein